jgi:hypothetical protein
MSRHGYSDDCEHVAMWRGVIASATRGKRGQAFFRALVEALDAMPEKRLIAGDLETEEGSVCALGCLGQARGVDLGSVDTYDWDALGEMFDIAPQLAQETMFVNDDDLYSRAKTPEERWRYVRAWAARQIRVEPGELKEQGNG